jgi:hypothetical protein
MRYVVWHRLALAAILMMTLQPCGEAQDIQLTPRAIGVIDPPHQAFNVGEQFKLNLDRKQLRAAGGAGALRARIIRSTIKTLTAAAVVGSPNDCVDMYYVLLPFREYNGGVSFLFSFPLDWIGVVAGQPTNAEYVLIFERFEEKVEKNAGVLKLRRSAISDYLSRAYTFVVRAPQEMAEAEVVEIGARQDQSRHRLVAAQSNETRCYDLSTLSAWANEAVSIRPVDCDVRQSLLTASH